MISRKLLLTAILSVILVGNSVFADSNDLLRMDVKKASTDDTVDVVFYTTGNPTNSVVTRKSGNTYVVLLPNVEGNQSIVPSLGGVKDLISNINVKNVEDGIGGYTKVTFNTTKPVKIRTSTKQTAPLTKAQQDYKNLIAQNSKFDPDKKMENFKQMNNVKPAGNNTISNVIKTANASTQAKKPVKQEVEPQKVSTKTVQTKPVTQNTNKISIKPIDIHVPQVQKNTEKSEEQQTKAINDTNNVKNNLVTNEKIQKNVENNVQKAKETLVSAIKPAFDLQNPPKESKNNGKTQQKTTNKKVVSKTVHKNLPIIPIAGAISVIGLFILGFVMNAIAKAISNNSNKLKEYLENYKSEQEPSSNTDYNEILEKENLNWQEKYKLYSQAKDNQTQNTTNSAYIANMNNSDGVLVEDMRSRVSQMEHAYSNTPSVVPNKDKKRGLLSEDEVIVRKMSGLNLKSFAKNVDLKRTTRSNINYELNKTSTNPLKEGKYVNLENSELTMSQRNIGGHGFSISDLVRTGKRFLPKKQITEETSKQEEQYLISSLEEYLKIIDKEENKVGNNVTEEISSLIPRRSRADMMLSTNPMSKSNNNTSSHMSEFNGISVTSKYDIDRDKSIYMIESDGISALIGKIGENITVLKKFDKVINKPLQVRLDYGSVYIVKVGGFKCLVDVAEDKMGTLLEI